MKRKMRRFAEGGLGYEEDPQPGVQSDREDKPKKPAKTGKPRTAQSKPRSMSDEEFVEKYKKSPTSDRIREEARKSANKDKASRAAPGTRVDMGGVSFGDPDMTREEQESIAKNTLKGAAAVGFGPTAIRRYGIGRNYERMSESERRNWVLRAAREAREVDGMKSGGSVEKFRKGGMPDLTGDGKVTRADVLKGRGVFKHGGKVKKYASGGSVSSASKRADGCAVKGKTKGRFV